MPNLERKKKFLGHLFELLENYKKILIVNSDRVGGEVLFRIRRVFRTLDAHLVLGKNTLMRKAIREYAKIAKRPQLQGLLPLLSGKVGLIFFNGNDVIIRELLQHCCQSVSAKTRMIAPEDIVIPTGGTGLDPMQTSLFSLLNIPTKISRGQIEIMHNVRILKKGEKVGYVEAEMLKRLRLYPFVTKLVPISLFEGNGLIPAPWLDAAEGHVTMRMHNAVSQVLGLGLAIRFPTTAAIPSYLLKSYKTALALGAAANFEFHQLSSYRKHLVSINSTPISVNSNSHSHDPDDHQADLYSETSSEWSSLDFIDLFD